MYNLQIITSKRSWFQFRSGSSYRNALKLILGHMSILKFVIKYVKQEFKSQQMSCTDLIELSFFVLFSFFNPTIKKIRMF